MWIQNHIEKDKRCDCAKLKAQSTLFFSSYFSFSQRTAGVEPILAKVESENTGFC